ncbi:hypothetical protein ACHAPJ_010258 [Fusarium lateritium]
MYRHACFCLAVGLIGLDAVAAGPCKPLTSASVISSATLTSSVTELTVSSSVGSAVTETSSSIESLMTETLSSTVVEATSTDLTSTLSLMTTSADLTTLSTTESFAATTDFSTTLTSSETTTEASTTTSNAPAETTTFFIVAGPGSAAGARLKSDNRFGTPLYLGERVTFPSQHHYLDTATGHLKAGDMSVCAYFTHGDQTNAYLTACSSEDISGGVVSLTCELDLAEGVALQCSVPVLQCEQLGRGVQNCATTTESLSKFSMLGDDRLVYIVSDDFTGINQTPVDLVINEADVPAPAPQPS